MPGDNIWTGAASGSVNTAGNWSAAAAPINGDEVIIRGTSTVALDADLAALTAVTADSITVASDFLGTIGTSGGTQFDISATQLNLYGRGEYMYFTGTYGRVNVDCGFTTQAANLDGTVTRLAHRGGNLTFNSGITITDCHVMGDRARLNIPAGATCSGALTVSAGYVKKQATYTTVYQSGGVIENANGNITTLILTGGANTRFTYNQGTITSLYLDGGYFDARNSGYRRTITNLYLISGTFDARDVGDTLTVTNDIIVLGSNVKLIDPTGALQRTLS